MTSFALPILMLVAAVGIFFGYSSSAYQETKALRADAAQYAEALSRTEELAQVRERLNTAYRSFDINDVDRLLAVLPDKVDDIRFALDLDSLARQNGVTLTNISVDGGAEEGVVSGSSDEALTLGSSLMTFSVMGSYESMIAFLQDLEKNLRLIDITDLAFVSSAEGVPTYTVGVRMYWLK